MDIVGKYDTADRLATVTDWAARVTRFRYEPATRRLARIELPNGTQRVFTYDSAGRVAGVRDEVAAGGALVSQFTLGYDALDRIVEETTLPEPAEFAVTAAGMSYDDDDRLTGWNSLVTQSDADGNLTKGPLGGVLTTFNYDARNRLASVGNTGYTYDAENRRISRAAPGSTTTFVHDPNAALSRLLQSTTGSTTTRYVYAGSLLLYAETGTSIRVHHYDYRGSTVALTDATGAVLGRVAYGSYGEIVARSGDTATEFLYNGRDGVVTDPNGLYHMRARYYSPETRRFLNADPIGFAAGTNWYAFVGGSPVMSTDPRGLDWLDTASNYAAGFGDAVSFGLTRRFRQALGYDDVVDKSSTAYSAGEWSGVAASVLAGGGGILKGGAQGLKTLLYDPRKFASISKAFWRAEGGAAGRALHHWMIPQSWGWVPAAIRNAGWNQIIIGGRLNTWMGFAQNWGGLSPYLAGAVENAIRFAMLGTLAAPITVGVLDDENEKKRR